MATYFPAKKNTAHVLYVSFISQANTKIMQANPTLAAGDAKVSIDGGALANLATLPAVTPGSSKAVKVDLSAAEMNGDNIVIIFSDAAGAEWCDLVINLQTTARQIDDLTYPTVSGRSLDVTATGAAGIDWANVENPTTALNLSGTNIDVDQVVASVSGAVGSVIGAVGSVTAIVTANVTQISGDTTAADRLESWLDSCHSGTAQAGAAGTITLDTGASATNDLYNGMLVLIASGTGAGQTRLISDYVGATKVATIVPNWTTNPSSDSVFVLFPSGRADIGLWLGSAPNALTSGRVDADVGALSGDSTAADNAESFFDGNGYAGTGNVIPTVTTVNGLAAGVITAAAIATDAIDADAIADNAINAAAIATGAITAAKFAAGAIDAAAIANGAIDAATFAAGAIDAAVIADGAIDAATFAAGAIDAAAIATDAIGSAELAASAVTEIQSGLATAAALATVQADTDDIQTRLPAALVSGRIDSSVGAIAANAITAASLATDAGGEIADAVWDEATSGHTTSGSFGQAVLPTRAGTAQAGAAGTITLDSGASSVDDFYNNQIITLTGGTGTAQARIISDYVGATKVATVNGNWATTPDSTSVFVLLPFGAIPGATAPTAGEVADAVWDEARAGHTAADTFGDYLDIEVSSRLAPTVAARTLDVSAGGEAGLDWANIGSPTTAQNLSATNIDVDQVVASVSGAVGSVTGNVGGNVVGSVASVTAAVTVGTNNDKTGYGLSAAAVQAIWDALTSALTTVGSIGKLLVDNVNATISSRLAPTVAARTLDVSAGGEAGIDWANIGSPTTAVNLSATNIDVDQVVASVSGAVGSVTGGVTVTTNNDKTGYSLSAAAIQAIWDALTSALTAAGSIGKLLVDNINATISSRSTVTTAQVNTEVDTALLDVGLTTTITGRIDAAVSSRSTVTTAQVNTEVVDALAVDTYAEPGSVPAATATLAAKIGWLFTLARNKRTTTSAVDTLRNDADAGTIATSAISDDGTTFVRNKYT